MANTIGSGTVGKLAYYAVNGTDLAPMPSPVLYDSTNKVLTVPGILITKSAYSEGFGFSGLSFQSYHNSVPTNSFNFLRGRGTSAAKLLPQTGDQLANIVAAGWNGTAPYVGATLRAVVNGTPGATSMPTEWVFGTHDGTSIADRVKITKAGQLNVNSISNFSGTDLTIAPAGKTLLGAPSKVSITGGSAGQALITDGAGNLSWSTISGSGATYTISAETATGGVNLRLTGSNSTTDDVKLAAGSNVTLTRTDASTITIAATGGGTGTVTSVGGTGTVAGLTLTGTVTTSGSLTLGGTLAVPIANITATGTRDSTTYLRGDGTWATGGGGGSGTVTSVAVSGGTTGLTTSGGPVTSAGTITLAGTLAVANGGTGQTTYINGQILIGNTTGNTLAKATLTQGTGITITNGAGSITIANSSPMDYPDAGIAVSTGTAWGTSKTSPTGTIVGTTDTQTLTNKRVQSRVLALSANSATPAINTDSYDMVVITAQIANITSMTSSLTGTPVNGQKLWIAFTATSGTPTIAWGTSFESSTVTLPTGITTTRSDVGFIWNAATSKWRCVAVA